MATRKALWLAYALLAGLSGCSTQGVEPPPPAAAQVYRLAPDDKLRIGVYGEEGLSGLFTVGSDGNISYPLLGAVKAAGLSLAELQALLTTRLRAGYVVDPKVSIDIGEYRPFYILGEVNKPGQYPYRAGLTLNAAVATAGGFTYRANHKTIAIEHDKASAEQRYRLTGSLLVQPGDTIRILERYF